MYPIRIDPTVSLTYADNGADAIADVTLQSANTSGGERTALVVGLRPYGISRILMKFPGIDFSEYEGVTITSATVSLRDIMCEDTEMTLSCYPFTGDAWEESTATWEGMNQSWGTLLDSHVISYYAEDGIASTHRYAFDISAAVQAWVDGDTTITPEKGLIFKADSAVENDTAQESRTFGSFERTNHKPVFSMTYQSGITLSHSSAELYVGDTLPLTATTAPAGQAVTWHSNNAAVASVDDNGVVTGLSEGTSTITAELADGSSAYCIIEVKTQSNVTLNYTSADVVEGGSLLLTATVVPPAQEITWISSNTSIATVNESGVVTGIRAGMVEITATLEDGTSAICIVRVVVPDGVYYIQNMHSLLYLNVENGGIANNTDVCQQNKHATTASDLEKIRQMWKICYLGNGCYSIRPLHKLDMGLHVNGMNVDIINIGKCDNPNAISFESEWVIEWSNFGYLFKNRAHVGFLTTCTMMANEGSMLPGVTVVSTYDNATYKHSQWNLQPIDTPPVGVIVYDTRSGKAMQTEMAYIAPGETKLFESMGLEIETYPLIYECSNFSWTYPGNNNCFVSNQGTVTGVTPGATVVYGSIVLYGKTFSVSIALTVTDVPNGRYVIQSTYRNWQQPLEITPEGKNDGWRIKYAAFSMSQNQQWEVIHTGDGYYTIRSCQVVLGGYLGYENNAEDKDEIFSRANDQSDDTRWKIEKNTEGNYEIRPKNAPDCLMQVLWGKEGNVKISPNVETDASFWIFINKEHIHDVEYVDQKEDAWCWIASALMFLKYYIPEFGTVWYDTQRVCAQHYYNLEPESAERVEDMAGTAKEAVDFYIEQKEYDLSPIYKEGEIYSKETLMQFVDDGHVLIIHQMWLTQKKDGSYEHSKNAPGHMYVLTGYVTIEGEIWFVLLDPGPGEDEGTALLMTYEELCEDQGTLSWSKRFWYSTLVLSTEYADETLPWKGPKDYEEVP